MQRFRSLIGTFLLVIIAICTVGVPTAARATATAPHALSSNYPVVLVSGFLGWGRDELGGYKYWGGFTDLQQDLINHGYQTFTASPGPVASNWDRACELYAEIKGGTVDYGVAHSQQYGHARFGRTYAGLYPQWGNVGPNGSDKITIIAHSMGGPTGRILIQLLEHGSVAERAATPAGQLSPLFTGGKSWVNSLLTISAPEDGTTLASGISMVPIIKQLLIGIASLAGAANEMFYDFDLDQWGLARLPGESFTAYANRVYNSNIWTSQDISAYDLTPEGAAKINAWVKAQPDVYYFSVATQDTYTDWFTWHQDPQLNMLLFLQPFASYMGAYTNSRPGTVPIDASWWPNDGVVNTRSMHGPTLNSMDRIVTYAGIAQRGVWDELAGFNSCDHLCVTGLELWDVRSTYEGYAALLTSLS